MKEPQGLPFPRPVVSIFKSPSTLHCSFDPDPLKRHTVWSIVVGGSMIWISVYSINQSQVQRYLACRSLAHAKT